MPETAPPPDITGLTLAEIATLAAERRLPPVDAWNPTRCGDSEMRIARDGTWFHQGAPIPRPAMVRLFSTILRRDPDGGYVLVTPAEKLDIAVDDAPFVAVELRSEGSGTARRLDHPLRIQMRDDGPHPYLRVRGGLDALVGRAVYYELAEMLLEESGSPAGLWSDGAWFPIGGVD
jgi:hypothetical protein